MCMIPLAVARIIASRWQALSSEERGPFDQIAKADKDRYYREMKEWKKNKCLVPAAQVTEPAVEPLAVPRKLAEVPRDQDMQEQPFFSASNFGSPRGQFANYTMSCTPVLDGSHDAFAPASLTNSPVRAPSPLLFFPIAPGFPESPVGSAPPVPTDPFSLDEDCEPNLFANYRSASFSVEMARLARNLDPFLMDHFIKSFR